MSIRHNIYLENFPSVRRVIDFHKEIQIIFADKFFCLQKKKEFYLFNTKLHSNFKNASNRFLNLLY